MGFMVQLLHSINTLMEENEDSIFTIAVLIVLLVLVLKSVDRKVRYVFIGSLGLVALIAVIALIANLGNIINIEAIHSSSDLFTVVGFIALVLAVAFIGWKVVRKSGKKYVSQVKLEHFVDKVHDAWDTRNERF